MSILAPVYSSHIPTVTDLKYTLNFPYDKAANLEQDPYLRKLRQDLPPNFGCSSLDGPVCPHPPARETLERIGKGGESEGVWEAAQIHRPILRQGQPERQNIHFQKTGERQNTADGTHLISGRSEDPPSKPDGLVSGHVSRPGKQAPLSSNSAFHLAALDVQCDVCLAMAQNVFRQVKEKQQLGVPTNRGLVRETVERQCRGNVPTLLTNHTIVPRGRAPGFAFGERGIPKLLNGFEAKSFAVACGRLLQEAGRHIEEAVTRALEQQSSGASGRGGVYPDWWLSTACAGENVCGDRLAPAPVPPLSTHDNIDALLDRNLTGWQGGVEGEGQRCIYVTQGWWTYELCHKTHILQFHAEEHLSTQSIMLGVFDLEATQSLESPRAPLLEASDMLPGMRHRLPYHSHVFTKGDDCEAEGSVRKRRTQVRFACSLDGEIHLMVNEPKTCRYVLTLYLPVMCEHPSFSQGATDKDESHSTS